MEDPNRLKITDLENLSPVERFCLVSDLLAGKLPDDLAREVEADLKKSNSLVFRAFDEMNDAVQPLQSEVTIIKLPAGDSALPSGGLKTDPHPLPARSSFRLTRWTRGVLIVVAAAAALGCILYGLSKLQAPGGPRNPGTLQDSAEKAISQDRRSLKKRESIAVKTPQSGKEPVKIPLEKPMDVGAALDALLAELHALPDPPDKDAETVRRLRKKIQNFRRSNPLVLDKRLERLKTFVVEVATPADAVADVRVELAIDMALAGEDAQPDGPIILRGDKGKKLHDTLTGLLRSDPNPDPEISRFLMRTRQSVDRFGIILQAAFGPNTEVGQEQWSRLIAAKRDNPSVPMRIVIDFTAKSLPANDHTYDDAIRTAKDCGIEVLGLIQCDNGNLLPDQIEAEVRLWHARYGEALGGFFFFRPPLEAKHVADYANVFVTVRSLRPNYVIVTCCWFSSCDEGFLSKAGSDVICIQTDGFDPEPRDWFAKYEPSRFGTIIAGERDFDQARGRITRAAGNHMSWVYVAPGDGWVKLPSFFGDEVAYVASLNAYVRSNGRGGPSPFAPINANGIK